ncbi:MAG TPA: HAD family phosphatase [Erysipelothrix sp.]|jgi:Cof subfamily protein (haloacid dehalogenase superfamily)|nr:HAD family phosphatase [Erysipelothrix sp.]
MSKMIKAIMCDLDGTLLNKDKKILNETKRALKEAQENGIRLILASSRSYFMLEDIIKELEMPKYEGLAVCMNGLQVVNTKTMEVREAPGLPDETVQKIYDYGKSSSTIIAFESEAGFQFYVPMKMRFGMPFYYFARYKKKRSQKRQINYTLFADFRFSPDQMFEIISDRSKLVLPVQKCGVIKVGRQSKMKQALQKMRLYFEDEANVIKISRVWADIMPLHVNKVSGLKMMVDQLDFTLDNVIAFGDAENDIEMLSEARIGIAMGNAMDSVKLIATDVTLDNDSNGIVHALKKYQVI